MIHEVDANLLEYPLDAIIHQANCFHTMGGGIALRIRQRHPEAYEADLQTKHGDFLKLGKFSVAVLPSNKHIYNMYSQFSLGMGKHTNYEAMYNGLKAIEAHAVEGGLKTIGLPKNMGCVLGGGDWRIVRQIIEVVFEKSLLDVYICNYNG
jgi:O-acetyl-ADP-ribose deacetylase (regulator of RNase III)